jgi:hypothetical protein
MDRVLDVLALGDRFSAAYRSIDDAVRSLGKVTYRDEKTFMDAADGVDFVRNSSFDVVVMPNPYGNGRRLEIYNSLRELDFPVIVFDRGGLPGSWFFDVGFNADSRSYHPLQWDRPLTEKERADVRDYLARVKDMAPLEAQGGRIGAVRLRQELRIGERKLLFVPLQRPSDTTTRFFCAPMASLAEFDNLVADVVGRTATRLKDWVVVAKKHPLEVDRPNIPALYADTAHINDLIEASDAVLLLNSGAGLLSLCWDKPVLIAGTAYYAHPMLNRSVRTADDVEYSLSRLPSVDPEIRDRFFHHLTKKVYSFGSFHTELLRQSDGAFRNITRRIDFNELRMPESIVKKKVCSLSRQ